MRNMKKILSLLCIIFIFFQISAVFVSAADVVEYYQDFENYNVGNLVNGNGISEVDVKNNANVASAITVEEVPVFDNSKAIKIYTNGLSTVTSGTDCFASVGNVDLMGETVIKVDVAFDNPAQTKSLLLRYQQIVGMFFTIMSIGPDPSDSGKGRINFNGQTGASDYLSLNPNERYSLTIVINRTALTGYMRVVDKDGAIVGTLSSAALTGLSVAAENSTMLRFQNMPGGQGNEGSFYIDNIAICKAEVPTNITTIPEDGSRFLDSEALIGFSVNWGVAVDSSAAEAQLKKLVGSDYVPVPDTVVSYGAKLTSISFSAEYETEYKVELSGFKTITGDSIPASEYYFSTRSEFVLPPDVSTLSPANNTRFNPGSSVLISATASSPNTDGEITKVEFYSDNSLLSSVTALPYEHTYTPANGQHKIHVVAYDNFGMSKKSEEVIINVKANDPPVISTSLTELASIDASAGILSVNCTDDGEVSNVSIFIDNEFFAEKTVPPYNFSLKGLSPQKHSLRIEATDNENASSSFTINEFYAEYRYNLYIAGSTSDMSSLSGNLSMVDHRGNHEFVTLDEEHGASLKISDNAGDNAPYLVMAAADLTNSQKIYSISTDLYFPDTAITLDCFTIRFDNATFYTPIQFSNGSVNGVPFDKDKWYNLRFEFGLGTNSSYRIYLDGIEIKTGTMNPTGTTITNLRFTLTAPGKSVYIDNLATYTYFAFPIVNNMQFTNSSGTTANSGDVPCDTTEIKVNLSDDVGSASFTNTYVAVKDNNGVELPVTISKGSANNQIVITNANILKNNTKYNIIFKKDFYVITGDRLPEDISVQFKTSASDFDVIDSGIFENGKRVNGISSAKGKNVKFNLDVSNKTNEVNNLVAICAVYKDNAMVDVVYKLISAAENTPLTAVSLDEIYVPNENGIRIEAYVWDSFGNRNSFSEPVIIR